MEKYTIDYLINKAKSIPHDLWRIGTIGIDDLPRCILGHCGGCATEEALAIGKILAPLDVFAFGKQVNVFHINDGKHPHYNQLIPKDRILAALQDVKAKQEPITMRIVGKELETILN